MRQWFNHLRRRAAPAPLPLLALLLLAPLPGCPKSSGNFYGTLYDDGGCRIGCDHCPLNAACVSVPYQPTCLQQCDTGSDCPSGQQCAQLDLPDQVSNVCVSKLALTYCDSPPACNLTARCADSQTLLTPLPFLD